MPLWEAKVHWSAGSVFNRRVPRDDGRPLRAAELSLFAHLKIRRAAKQRFASQKQHRYSNRRVPCGRSRAVSLSKYHFKRMLPKVRQFQNVVNYPRTTFHGISQSLANYYVSVTIYGVHVYTRPYSSNAESFSEIIFVEFHKNSGLLFEWNLNFELKIMNLW